MLLGCSLGDPEGLDEAGGRDGAGASTQRVESPQSLVFFDGLLVVGSAGFDGVGYGPGAVTAFDPERGERVARVPTTQRNPQKLVVHEGTLYVVNSGVLDFSDPARITAVEPGGVDRWTPSSLRSGESGANTPLPPSEDATVGFPVDLVFAGGVGVIGSGIASAVFLIRPDGTLERGASDPVWYGEPGGLGLGALAEWGDRVLLVDFNSDRLHPIEPGEARAWPCSVDLGRSDADLEGPVAVARGGDQAVVPLSLAGVLLRVDLGTLDPTAADCGAPEVTQLAVLGQSPNHVALSGGRAFVVESGDNAVSAFAVESGAPAGRWTLDAGANPWHVAVDPEGRWLAVSEWAADAVTLIDLDSGERRRLTLP